MAERVLRRAAVVVVATTATLLLLVLFFVLDLCSLRFVSVVLVVPAGVVLLPLMQYTFAICLIAVAAAVSFSNYRSLFLSLIVDVCALYACAHVRMHTYMTLRMHATAEKLFGELWLSCLLMFLPLLLLLFSLCWSAERIATRDTPSWIGDTQFVSVWIFVHMYNSM